MGDKEIVIDVDTIEAQLQVLRDAIYTLEPFTKQFVKETREAFTTFNSDFFSKLDSVLKHVNDGVVKDILEQANEIYDQTSLIVESFTEIDQTITSNLQIE